MPLPESAAVAAELRTAMGKLTRRVKLEDQMPLGQVAVLGSLDRNGAMTTSELAADQRVRPQSMARAVGLLMEQGLITRRRIRPTAARAWWNSPPRGGCCWRRNGAAGRTGSRGRSRRN